MDDIKTIFPYIDAIANTLTIIASAIAIGVYFSSRKRIGAAINLLLNYSFQTSLVELKQKIESLNDHKAADQAGALEIRSILLEIVGHVRGNPRLSDPLNDLAAKAEKLAGSRHLTDALKRSLVSELREFVRHLQVKSMNLENDK